MEKAMNKDKEESGEMRRRWQIFKPQRKRAEDTPSRVVNFHLLKSITDMRPTLVPRERRLSNVALCN